MDENEKLFDSDENEDRMDEEIESNGPDNREDADLLALPPHGSEVYIDKISPDATEDKMRMFCEDVGPVTEVRVMKGKDSNDNKGFAFVSFRNAEIAKKAIQILNNTQFKGKRVKCSPSQAKNRLHIGNVPKNWSYEDLKNVVMEVGPGITSMELVKDVKHSQNNRGFAIISYYNHACAEYSRQKMTNPNFKLDNITPTITWAGPKNAISSATSQLKAIYVKNLPRDVTEDQLMKIFENHGKVTKIVIPPAKPGQEKKRIGFVHFAERSSTMKALLSMETYEINGQVVECFLAKPQAEQKLSISPKTQKSALLPNYVPPAAFGLVGGAYGARFGASSSQSLIFGRGPTPSSVAMVPMLLPNGQIGYLLQQPSVRSHTPFRSCLTSVSGSESRGNSSQSRQNNESGHWRRYQPRPY